MINGQCCPPPEPQLPMSSQIMPGEVASMNIKVTVPSTMKNTIYPLVLFWCEFLSFGDMGRRDVFLL